MAYLPCQNPDCKSEGKAHPNCHCYDFIHGNERNALEKQGYQFPGTTKGMKLRGTRGGNLAEARKRGRGLRYMAKGGEVSHFCNYQMPHKPGCQYFKGGGEVHDGYKPAHPSVTLGHAAVTHGLLGLLSDVGHAKMSDPKASESLIHGKLGDHLMAGDNESASSVLYGHPLSGGASRENLKHIVPHLAPRIVQEEPNPEALRGSSQYLNSALGGDARLESHMGKLIGKQKASDEIEIDKKARQSLADRLHEYQQNPEKMLEIGGSLGHYLPDHAAALGALASTARDYFKSLKPYEHKPDAMSEPMPPDHMAQYEYNRQLDIAQNPSMVIQHMRDGVLMPQDVATLKTLYPALHKSMADKIGSQIVGARAKGTEIPYHQKASLSMFLGEPLDMTMTQPAMAAIIASAAGQQAINQENKKKRTQPTAATQKTLAKTDSLYETPNETLQINKKG